MTEANRITADDIKLGLPLEWDVYDNIGRLLLRKGYVINSPSQLEALSERNMFRHDLEAGGFDADLADAGRATPVDRIRAVKNALGTIFHKMKTRQCPDLQEKVYRIAGEIQKLCERDVDLVIGVMHLEHDGRYTIFHPVYNAMLTEILGKRMAISNEERISIIASALTANVAIYDLQEILYRQKTPPTDIQLKALRRHPVQGVELLLEAGVTDELWYETILFHHEKINGSGYPANLRDDAIPLHARIVSVCDVYTAMVSPQAYRDEFLPREALRDIFMRRGSEIDIDLANNVVNELGIYPPGCWVMLQNGETGIVTRRTDNNTCPEVNSLVAPDGTPYPDPLVRNSCEAEYAIKATIRRRQDLTVCIEKLWGYHRDDPEENVP